MRPYTLPLGSCHSDIQWYESPPSPEWDEITNIENTRPTDPNQGAILEIVRNPDQTTDFPLRARWIGVDPPVSEPDPDAAAFYNALASCDEYGAVFGYAVANPTTPIPFLIGVTIATAAEAKSYQQSGGQGTSFDRVDAALTSLITALPATVGDFTKADIVAKIQAIAEECRVSLPSVV